MLLASVNYYIFICDLPTAPVRFSFASILVVEILDRDCGADAMKTQTTWVNGVYRPGEVAPTQQQFMLAEPAPIMTSRSNLEVYKA